MPSHPTASPARPAHGTTVATSCRRSAPPRPRTGGHVALARTLGAALVATAAVPGLGALSASADEIPSAVTSMTLSTTTLTAWESVRADVTWAVPDSAVAGDTVRVTLPSELVPSSTTEFDVRDDGGAVVAEAVWDGSTAVLTLTEFVSTRTGVHGTGFFDVRWNAADAGTDPTTTVLDLVGSQVPVTMVGEGEPDVPDPAPGKWGYWTRPDQGATTPEGALRWVVRLPSGPSGVRGPVTVVDTPGPGQVVDCGTLRLDSRVGPLGASPRDDVLTASPDRVTDLTCSPSGVSLVLDTIRPEEYLQLRYTASLDGTPREEYTNHATITTAAGGTEVDGTRTRSTAGGSADGVPADAPPAPTPTPSVDPTPGPAPSPTPAGEPGTTTPPTSGPSSEPAPTASVESAATAESSESLATTGASGALGLASAGAALLAAGGSALWLSRRRAARG